MRGLLPVIGHLDRQAAAVGQERHQARDEFVMVGQPLQRRVGEDQVGPVDGRHAAMSSLWKAIAGSRARAAASICSESSTPMISACGKRAAKQLRAGAGAAAEIDDAPRVQTHAGEQVAGGLGALGLEFQIERRVPIVPGGFLARRRPQDSASPFRPHAVGASPGEGMEASRLPAEWSKSMAGVADKVQASVGARSPAWAAASAMNVLSMGLGKIYPENRSNL